MVVYTSKHVRNNFETKAPNTDLASALNSSFDLGLDSFKHQLSLLSDLQYAHLLTLLDEYPLRKAALDRSAV